MPGTLTSQRREAIQAQLEARLSPHRYRHTLGVAATARAIAERVGADPDAAELAGLLHDLAREWKPPQLLSAAREAGMPLGPLDLANPMASLHAPLGAEVARREFGVEDPDVLRAIASHTMGREAMSLLERILFIADAIEPGRGEADYLAELRALAAEDLGRACLRAYDSTFEYLIRTGQPIHPQAVAGRNWLIHSLKERPHV